MTARRVIGVYDADGTLIYQATYGFAIDFKLTRNGAAVPGTGLLKEGEGKPRPAVLIAELPEENEQFQLVHYGLYALRHVYNKGLRFNRFRVPSFRVDLKREVDLLEEIARLYGVDRIPTTAPRGAIGSNTYDLVHDELAEALGAPVATTAAGKGVFPEVHPLALGVFGIVLLEPPAVVERQPLPRRFRRGSHPAERRPGDREGGSD